jgi:hypothetical protein
MFLSINGGVGVRFDFDFGVGVCFDFDFGVGVCFDFDFGGELFNPFCKRCI